ncbi:outer membrane protein W [Pontibacter aydingkolensis]|uniref:PorT family protein n=1 Tax=Pontibacter aydingkolensis TaxID=1911536 RepID=A0ABS7CTG9_9BACT|nr:porin family protein [Pontibacter aydingkolensis]MBW7467155.1 PorT family protein [Pontibacter aydingkolensis]
MKQTLQAAFLLFVFILTSSAVQAQSNTTPAYLITAKSDTLQGILLKEKNMSESINFKQTGSEDFQRYPAKDIRGYSTSNSIFYESKEVKVGKEDRVVLLRVIVDGPVKLYSGSGLIDGVEFYIQKPDSPVTQLYQGYYKGTISSVTSDCDAFQVSSENLPKYTATSLSDYVRKYSACKYSGNESKVYLNHSRVGVSYGIRAAMLTSSLQFDSKLSETSDDFNTNNNLSAGIFLNFHMAGNKWSIQPEISYTQYSFESVYEYQHPVAIDYTNTFTYKTTQLQVPLLLKYTFGENRMRPFVNAGPSINFLISNDIQRTTTNEIGQTWTKSYDDANRSVGYLGGAGLQYTLNDKRAVLLELRYSRDIYNNEIYNMRAVISGYHLSAAITL